jgi:hypothetical protein
MGALPGAKPIIEKRTLLPVHLFVLSLCLLGCQPQTGGTETNVLLRYSPEVGDTYTYSAVLVGYTEITGEMTVVGEEDGWYRVVFSGPLFGERYDVTMNLSDRHNADHPGYISLNFPDDPVAIGGEWRGEVPWYFENYFVLEDTPITVPASYKLVDIKQETKGRYAVIEQTVDVDVVVDSLPFHVGQLGVRWDVEGRITEVRQGYDAFDKLMVGDMVVGLNGQSARSEHDRNRLAEEHIQHPKGDRVVSLTVLRDGKELTVDIEKSIDHLALVKVENMRGSTRIEWDIDRGLLLSAEVSISEDITFSSPAGGVFPIVDSYGGFSKFGYLEGLTAYEDSYGGSGVAWKLTLQE